MWKSFSIVLFRVRQIGVNLKQTNRWILFILPQMEEKYYFLGIKSAISERTIDTFYHRFD